MTERKKETTFNIRSLALTQKRKQKTGNQKNKNKNKKSKKENKRIQKKTMDEK